MWKFYLAILKYIKQQQKSIWRSFFLFWSGLNFSPSCIIREAYFLVHYRLCTRIEFFATSPSLFYSGRKVKLNLQTPKSCDLLPWIASSFELWRWKKLLLNFETIAWTLVGERSMLVLSLSERANVEWSLASPKISSALFISATLARRH